MDSAFVQFGHGYETGSRGRCTAFDGFDVIAAPLGEFGAADRESRSFPGRAGRPGVTYASHAIKLARRQNGHPGELYILMHHGGGREVLRVPTFYDGGALETAILAMPERLQYALLYSIWHAAANARREAEHRAASKYSQAFIEKRLKKRRKDGRVWVDVVTAAE